MRISRAGFSDSFQEEQQQTKQTSNKQMKPHKPNNQPKKTPPPEIWSVSIKQKTHMYNIG